VWQVIVAVIGLVGSAGGAMWAAYVGTRRRVLAELEGQYDAALREARLKVYAQLWAELQPLAKYAREPPGWPTRIAIEDLAVSLRRWYFEQGGFYLSAEAREAYFLLQDALAAVIEAMQLAETKTSEQIDCETFKTLRIIGSQLRTTLTYDVGTRRRFSLAPEWQEQDAEANRRAVEEALQIKAEAKLLQEKLKASGATRESDV
jgi:hypothetical protein